MAVLKPAPRIDLPDGDTALDSRRHVWHRTQPAPSPFDDQWICVETGAGATTAHLTVAYRPVVFTSSAAVQS